MSLFKDGNLFKLKLFDLNKKIEKKYLEAEKTTNEKKSYFLNDKSTVNEYLASRSSYKQFLRLFIEGKTTTYKAVTFETKQFADQIIKNNFDYFAMSKNGINQILKLMKEYSIDKKMTKYTPLGIYLDTLEVLSNKQLLSNINKWYKKAEPIAKTTLKNNQADSEHQDLYKLSFLINNYTCLLFLARSLEIQIIFSFIMLETYQKEITIQSLCDQHVNMYRWFLNHIAVNHIPMIVYFQKVDLKVLNSEIDKNFVESVAKENWDGRNLSEMTGIESVTLGIIVAIGIGLGLTILLPTIRSMIYYWGCLKVSLSNFYSDESIYLAFNVKRLKEELSRETDPKKRERLELIIEKQEKEIAKLEEKAYKLSIQFEENASQVEKNMEADTEVEDNEYFESYQPQVLI